MRGVIILKLKFRTTSSGAVLGNGGGSIPQNMIKGISGSMTSG